MTYDPRAKGLADGLYPERTGKTTRVVATLAARDAIPENGRNESGESAGYQWAVRSQPYAAAPATAPPGATVPPLHELELSISWRERGQDKLLQLRTLRPQRLPVAAQGMP